ncbi:MAG: hypothetical protein WA860_10715 [Acidimicrobiales bacterium]
MSDINDRLAALDPAASDPYRAPNLNEMISRITATPSGAARSTWWQRVQLRIAGALILGSLVGATTFVLVDNGANLPVLAIQNLAQHRTAAAPFNSDTMQPYEEIDFAAGASLSNSSSSTSSYQLQIPASAATETVRVASIFGVSGTPHEASGNWTVTSPSGATVDYDTTGLPQWYYSSTTPAIAPATYSSSATAAVPSHATLAADAQGYLAKLAYGYDVSSPDFSTSTTSTTAQNGTQSSQSQEEVSYVVSVNGLATDQTVSFSVDSQNNLVYAQGPAFHVAVGTSYPLQSPANGVSTLNATEQAAYPTSTGANAKGPPIVHAMVNSASLSLATYELKDGTTWLLPLYTYSGNVSQKDGTRSSGTWSELALEPSYVQISPSVARGVVNY